MKEAYLYKEIKNNRLRCDLCSHRCVIGEDKKGKCGVRKNINGKLYTLVYNKVISENVDPIEKKPLFHFLPGTLSLSIATPGCNFKCFFCQNYEISQMPSDNGIIQGKEIKPSSIVEDALNNDCSSIAYTYTEPTIFFELAYDTAKIAHGKAIKNLFVTNGFMSKESLDMISPYLDAANVDLKSFSEEFYKDKVGARLGPVLENIKYMKKLDIWIEITTLLIPGLNDSDEELEDITKFIKDVDEDIPWHVSAYYPRYKSNIRQTELSSIKRAIETGKRNGLNFVYGGNISTSDYENTYCPVCNELIIQRSGYMVMENKVNEQNCSNCGKRISGVFH